MTSSTGRKRNGRTAGGASGTCESYSFTSARMSFMFTGRETTCRLFLRLSAVMRTFPTTKLSSVGPVPVAPPLMWMDTPPSPAVTPGGSGAPLASVGWRVTRGCAATPGIPAVG